ncbi:hypothetical protein [Sphingomonas lenta]|uniref:Uncharacterized protein n=1 Tax=Sphingomonas lenta TaxID=1141887 RepID=A0A2A2SDN9_9SPHN|nr:hypothetical protein [Sphingomonas lenta]PAX07325.1 hypothetical protein CKY28_15020 [Sphingomonas lenta]
MERVFRPLGARPSGSQALVPQERGGGVARARKGGRWITVAAPALLLLFLLAFAVHRLTAGVGGPTATQAPEVRVAQRPAAQAAPPSADPTAPPTPDAVADLKLQPDRPVPDATAGASPRADESPEPRSSPPAAAPSAAPRSGEARRSEDVAPATAARSSEARERAARGATPAPRPSATRVLAAAPPERRTQRATAPRRRGCAPGSPEDHCIYQDVLAAHNRLSASYERAKRSGVPAEYLFGVRARWARARKVADDEPDAAIARYNRLADFLDRSSRGERR